MLGEPTRTQGWQADRAAVRAAIAAAGEALVVQPGRRVVDNLAGLARSRSLAALGGKYGERLVDVLHDEAGRLGGVHG